MDQDREEEYRRRGFTKNADGSWAPTWDYIEESLRKIREGDREYLNSLVTMRRDEATGNWVPVDQSS